MQNTQIYYFSGTGNCMAIAKQLAMRLGNTDAIAITAELVESRPEINCETFVLIFPPYAYGPPSLVRKFFKTATIKAQYIAALASCGSKAGGAFASVQRLLRRKGARLDFAAQIKSVENYVHIFGWKTQEVIDALNEGQRHMTDELAGLIESRTVKKVFPFRPGSALISLLFRGFKPFLTLGYKVTDSCNGCGLCRAICPSAAIEMFQTEKGKRPKFNAKKCDHCQGCLNWCPQKSLKYLRIKPDSQRYHHPDITASEMRKR